MGDAIVFPGSMVLIAINVSYTLYSVVIAGIFGCFSPPGSQCHCNCMVILLQVTVLLTVTNMESALKAGSANVRMGTQALTVPHVILMAGMGLNITISDDITSFILNDLAEIFMV